MKVSLFLVAAGLLLGGGLQSCSSSSGAEASKASGGAKANVIRDSIPGFTVPAIHLPEEYLTKTYYLEGDSVTTYQLDGEDGWRDLRPLKLDTLSGFTLPAYRSPDEH